MIKVNRSPTAPLSLAIEKKKANGSYKCEDVVKALRSDFKDKCYLCELKNLTDPEVEHLLPHGNGKDKDRKFDWNNLFWACRHCNSVKNQTRYSQDVIDCCKVDPKYKISHYFNDGKVHIVAIDNGKDSENTAHLIEECFEFRNTGIRIAACDARVKQLQKVLDQLFDNLIEYKKSNNEYVKNKIISLIKNDAPFASFTQQYIRDHIESYEDFKQYI